MRTFLALAMLAALAGCASMGGMHHGQMTQEDMMQHCQMMEQHQGQSGHDAAHHDPAQHGGMSHEEMMRRCAAMHDQTAPSNTAPPQH